ncbi:alpha/beta fold hydrolase [Hydrogenophaga pseudoflava]|jgi:pimeloyl-ACP methyl ester carboxylesterase|uniref:3-oxoadipate enol-lactonase 2 n=1 Tax=Hydrogenophaga pseudoflava TaxID=47421 RepID=A0A4P6WXP2_HYDPS|nr:alpha/beta fold hydrolase [Hydrogenophaga pseudoflava]QBM27135.1 3-oxoadipate enol-lactonase 2 [Hydrogenophaga pseudoflava]
MKVEANGVRIEVDDQGPADGPVVLLIMGLGMQLIAWPQTMVQMLVRQGFRVVRFDNRDIGLSQGFDAAGVPNMALAGLRHAMHLPVHSPYSLADMARDALGVLDALDIEQAHVCGASMGGMIAQHLAAMAPERVASLTLMMTTSGSRRLPQPSWRVRRALMSRPMKPGADAAVDWIIQVLHLIGSPAYPSDPQALRARALESVQRAWHPSGSARQLLAVVADGDRSALLPHIQAPTLVIHGVDDPLVPVACGEDLAQRIADARADFIPGMGHDLPEELLPRFAQGIVDNARR